MALSLAEIRAKLQAQENKTGDRSTGSFGDGAVFPHWNIDEGETCVIRFAPDGDVDNPFFWIEKAMIKLPFNGIVGGDQKIVIVQVPCMEMWNETCPILTEVRPWFKDKALEDMGRKYWKKRSYITQGFVRESGMSEENVPENPIRRFILGPSLFSLVKSALLDPELDNLPTDYEAGLDFRITKTSKGGFSNYDTSTWARRESALRDDERQALEKFGLSSLKEFLPKKPSSIEQSVMLEMFEASVDGKAYDPDKWAAHFRPPGVQAPGRDGESKEAYTAKPAAEAPKAPTGPVALTKDASGKEVLPWEEDKVESAEPEDDTPAVVEKAESSASTDKAKQILDMIKSRQKTA